MPDVWTHMLCSDDMRDDMRDDMDASYAEVIKENINLFHFGAQGPDLFFYYHFWPWQKKEYVHVVGNTLHTEKTGQFIVECLKFLKPLDRETSEYKLLFTYLAGFICHHVLDRNAHPYIYYFGGITEAGKPETQNYEAYHKKLEIMIDTILLQEKRHLEAYKTPVYKELDCGSNLPEIVAALYQHSLQEVYQITLEKDTIGEAYRDMKKGLKFLFDPSGVKSLILKGIEKITRKKWKIASAIYLKNQNMRKDYLNRGNNVWCHPCNQEEVYNKSFYDLYNQAVLEGKSLLQAAIQFLEDHIGLEELQITFEDISYLTGKRIDKDSRMQWHDCIYD